MSPCPTAQHLHCSKNQSQYSCLRAGKGLKAPGRNYMSPCIWYRVELVASLNGPHLGERRYWHSRPSVYPRPTPTLARHVGVPCASRRCAHAVPAVRRGSAPAPADWPGGRTRRCVPSWTRRRETRSRDTPALVRTAGERRTTSVRHTGAVTGHVDTYCQPGLIRAGQQ
jgi:hypothetical protein